MQFLYSCELSPKLMHVMIPASHSGHIPLIIAWYQYTSFIIMECGKGSAAVTSVSHGSEHVEKGK
jgi:hypothetical protein